jgi:hypothetical protein
MRINNSVNLNSTSEQFDYDHYSLKQRNTTSSGDDFDLHTVYSTENSESSDLHTIYSSKLLIELDRYTKETFGSALISSFLRGDLIAINQLLADPTSFQFLSEDSRNLSPIELVKTFLSDEKISMKQRMDYLKLFWSCQSKKLWEEDLVHLTYQALFPSFCELSAEDREQITLLTDQKFLESHVVPLCTLFLQNERCKNLSFDVLLAYFKTVMARYHLNTGRHMVGGIAKEAFFQTFFNFPLILKASTEDLKTLYRATSGDEKALTLAFLLQHPIYKQGNEKWFCHQLRHFYEKEKEFSDEARQFALKAFLSHSALKELSTHTLLGLLKLPSPERVPELLLGILSSKNSIQFDPNEMHILKELTEFLIQHMSENGLKDQMISVMKDLLSILEERRKANRMGSDIFAKDYLEIVLYLSQQICSYTDLLR